MLYSVLRLSVFSKLYKFWFSWLSDGIINKQIDDVFLFKDILFFFDFFVNHLKYFSI